MDGNDGEGFKPMDCFYYPDDPAILFLKGSKQAEYNIIHRNDLPFVFSDSGESYAATIFGCSGYNPFFQIV